LLDSLLQESECRHRRMSGSATKLKKKRRPSVSPLTTNTEIEAHRSLERYQTRELRKKESESLEKRPVSVVISKDGEEPLSQKELYKKKIARHNERRRARGGEESPAESPEVVAKPRPKLTVTVRGGESAPSVLTASKRAKLKLLVSNSEPKNDLQVGKENTNTSNSTKRELSTERNHSPKKE